MLLALFGPTGVGKTGVALAVADRLRARGERPVAVSADALQVYRGLETLTGVATAEEQRRLEHRLVSFLPVDARFSAGEYAQLAHAEIDDLLGAGATPIVVGGTGLYLRAALAELDLKPAPPAELRHRWEERMVEQGPEALHAELVRRAPWAAERVDRRDRSRIIRFLELDDLGELEPPEGPNQLWTQDTRHPTRLVGLTMDRDALYELIDRRVDAMVAAGAVDEVRRAHAAGASEASSRSPCRPTRFRSTKASRSSPAWRRPRSSAASSISSTRALMRSYSASRSIPRPISRVGWRVSLVHSWESARGGSSSPRSSSSWARMRRKRSRRSMRSAAQGARVARRACSSSGPCSCSSCSQRSRSSRGGAGLRSSSARAARR